MDDLYRLLDIDRNLVAEFSIVFSRFEYALKRTPPYAAGDEKGVKADWDKFAKDHDALFAQDTDKELKVAVGYLQSHPPEKQILRDNKLGWQHVCQQDVPPLQNLLLSVRRIRNNLFHGGKFPIPDGPVHEPGRDTALLQSCKTVLLKSLGLNDEVRRHFESGER
jgi:hypothetical protein